MLVNMMEKLTSDKESLRALFHPPAKIIVLAKKNLAIPKISLRETLSWDQPVNPNGKTSIVP